MQTKFKTFVINLDTDVDRWATISASVGGEPAVELVRVPGVYGPAIPQIARAILAGNANWAGRRGELGVFLSHLKAWEAVSASEAPACIILEDDAVPLGFGRIASLEIPADADLIFLNDRMSPGSRFSDPTAPVRCIPLIEALRALNRSGFGVGGDGYVVTPAGSAKLLEAVANDLCYGHVDWRLLRYSVAPADLGGDIEGTRVDGLLRHHHNKLRPPAWGVIKSYCLDNPLVAFATAGISSRAKASGE